MLWAQRPGQGGTKACAQLAGQGGMKAYAQLARPATPGARRGWAVPDACLLACSELRSATFMLVANSRLMTEQSAASRLVSCAVSVWSKNATGWQMSRQNSWLLRGRREGGTQGRRAASCQQAPWPCAARSPAPARRVPRHHVCALRYTDLRRCSRLVFTSEKSQPRMEANPAYAAVEPARKARLC